MRGLVYLSVTVFPPLGLLSPSDSLPLPPGLQDLSKHCRHLNVLFFIIQNFKPNTTFLHHYLLKFKEYLQKNNVIYLKSFQVTEYMRHCKSTVVMWWHAYHWCSQAKFFTSCSQCSLGIYQVLFNIALAQHSTEWLLEAGKRINLTMTQSVIFHSTIM